MIRKFWGWRFRFAILGAFGAIVVGALAFGAVALAQTPTPTKPAPGALYNQFVQLLAQKLGKDEAAVKTAIVDTQKDLIKKAVTEGRLTQARADALIKRLEQSGGAPLLGPFHRFQHFKRDRDDRGPFGRAPFRAFVGNQVKIVADFLGVPPAEVLQQLRQGKSLAEIAAAKGKSRDDLKAAILAGVQKQATELVTAKKLTQEQADRLVQRARDNLDRIVDAKLPVRPLRGARLGNL